MLFSNISVAETYDYLEDKFRAAYEWLRDFDIQYMVSGREQFGVCKRDGLKVKERIEENDVIFYEEPEFSGSVLLEEGDLIIVAPEDAHKPRCAAGKPCDVKKVVVKIAL